MSLTKSNDAQFRVRIEDLERKLAFIERREIVISKELFDLKHPPPPPPEQPRWRF